MEHSTINLSEAQRIIAACQSEEVPCLPRPVSHSDDYIKPLLESGADGILIQMVNTSKDVQNLINNLKFPPIGKRSYGVNRPKDMVLILMNILLLGITTHRLSFRLNQ